MEGRWREELAGAASEMEMVSIESSIRLLSPAGRSGCLP